MGTGPPFRGVRHSGGPPFRGPGLGLGLGLTLADLRNGGPKSTDETLQVLEDKATARKRHDTTERRR